MARGMRTRAHFIESAMTFQRVLCSGGPPYEGRYLAVS